MKSNNGNSNWGFMKILIKTMSLTDKINKILEGHQSQKRIINLLEKHHEMLASWGEKEGLIIRELEELSENETNDIIKNLPDFQIEKNKIIKLMETIKEMSYLETFFIKNYNIAQDSVKICNQKPIPKIDLQGYLKEVEKIRKKIENWAIEIGIMISKENFLTESSKGGVEDEQRIKKSDEET